MRWRKCRRWQTPRSTATGWCSTAGSCCSWFTVRYRTPTASVCPRLELRARRIHTRYPAWCPVRARAAATAEVTRTIQGRFISERRAQEPAAPGLSPHNLSGDANTARLLIGGGAARFAWSMRERPHLALSWHALYIKYSARERRWMKPGRTGWERKKKELEEWSRGRGRAGLWGQPQQHSHQELGGHEPTHTHTHTHTHTQTHTLESHWKRRCAGFHSHEKNTESVIPGNTSKESLCLNSLHHFTSYIFNTEIRPQRKKIAPF